MKMTYAQGGAPTPEAAGGAAVDRGDLFSPGTLGALELRNRTVLAPMTRNRAGKDGVPTPMMAEYYAQRASAGLLVAEMTIVSPGGYAYVLTPGIHTEAQVQGWRSVTDAVHRAGGRIVLQLGHAGRVSHPSMLPEGVRPVAPSAVAAKGKVHTYEGEQEFVEPEPLDEEGIRRVIREFAEATARAREAGFDGVELHGASGYLIDQFLRDGTNLRDDDWGGTPRKRARFMFEVARAAAEAWSADRVGVRVSPFNPFNSMSDSDPVAHYPTMVAELARLGLAYLHVVEAATEESRQLTSRLREAFGGPVIVNGGYDRERAEEALESKADAVSFGVPFLANPDLPRRLRAGASLNRADRDTFYGGGEEGYLDYPVLESSGAPSGEEVLAGR